MRKFSGTLSSSDGPEERKWRLVSPKVRRKWEIGGLSVCWDNRQETWKDIPPRMDGHRVWIQLKGVSILCRRGLAWKVERKLLIDSWFWLTEVCLQALVFDHQTRQVRRHHSRAYRLIILKLVENCHSGIESRLEMPSLGVCEEGPESTYFNGSFGGARRQTH